MDFFSEMDARIISQQSKGAPAAAYLSDYDYDLSEVRRKLHAVGELMMKGAGLSPDQWIAAAPSLILLAPGNTMECPNISAVKPAYHGVLHMTCCSRKHLLYYGKRVKMEDAIEFLEYEVSEKTNSFICKLLFLVQTLTPGALQTACKPQDLEVFNPEAWALLDAARDLCQPRIDLERGMKPWAPIGIEPGAPTAYAKLHHGIIFEAETVACLPPWDPSQQQKPGDITRCPNCKGHAASDRDVLLHMVFLPRQSPHPYNPWGKINAFQMGSSSILYPQLVVNDNIRRGRQTKRLMDLAIEYVDYSPDKHFPVGSLEHKDVMHVIQGVDATVPDEFENARFKWTIQME